MQPNARITILTGAGVSAASGVPTFRGPDGLWKNFRPESLATPDAFRRDPKLVWEWYDWRRQILSEKKPNRAHEVLAAWSRRYRNFALITQNVDGLHEKAGTLDVIRFHGSIWEIGCWNNCVASPRRWMDETAPFPQIPPTARIVAESRGRVLSGLGKELTMTCCVDRHRRSIATFSSP